MENFNIAVPGTNDKEEGKNFKAEPCKSLDEL